MDTFDDLSCDALRSTLHEFASKDHSAFDCFVCCILSHGALDSIYDCNGVLLTINELMCLFTNANCPTLRDKPKVFILQACQGKAKEGQAMLFSCDKESVKNKEVIFRYELTKS